MKIILAALNARYIHSNLAIRYLKASASEYDIDILEYTINENILNISIDIISQKPDIVGFSCYIWNIENTLKVCETLHEMDKNIKIILGGPEVSYDTVEFIKSHPYVDYIIKGEGEEVFKELLDSFKSGNYKPFNINGVVFRDEDQFYGDAGMNVIKDLNTVPFPYKDGIPDKIIYYEATRGCPFNCSYCLSSTIKGIRYLDIKRVKRELSYFIDNGVKLVKFVDRTFNANKKFAMEIWEYLIENSKNTSFHFEIAADIMDDDEIELLKKAPPGLFQLEIGVQTTNEKILKNINRIMDFNKVKGNVQKIEEKGNIHCHLDLIAGLPGENLNSFRKSFDMCMEIRPQVLQLGFLKVLKGSPICIDKERYGIHNISYPPYQVLYTNDISLQEMVELLELEEVFETYYNSGIFSITMNYILDSTDSTYSFFMDFCSYLRERDFLGRNIDLKGKFKLLYDFMLISNKDKIIADIMIHDFILTTKKSWLPDFLKMDFSKENISIVNDKREKIIEQLGNVDFKRTLCLPTRVKILKNKGKYSFKEYDGIVVFELDNRKFSYINF